MMNLCYTLRACHSRDVARVFRVTDRLEFGIVGVNGEGSRRGVEEFLEMKYMFPGGLSD